MSYHHFTIDERESILIYRMQGLNFSQIAKLLHRHPSSISCEWMFDSSYLVLYSEGKVLSSKFKLTP